MSKLSLLLLLSSLFVHFWVLANPIPQYDEQVRQGVASCASSTCHGSVFPRNTTKVSQNEYVIWSRHDAHASAYKTLLNKESKSIAAKLGLPNAHEAKICLDCHADNVPSELRGERFVIEDGVGCEACHGGAENYLSSHTSATQQHLTNIKQGLYPTDHPETRAKLCLSCHMGDATKMASHDIMGAGHPRLSFELDTFTILQPQHFTVDKNYKAFKTHSSNLETWMIGQIQAASSKLELIETRLFLDGALFPELALFDCHSCHSPMSKVDWNANKGRGLKPGMVRLSNGHFTMVQALADSIVPASSDSLKKAFSSLNKSIHANQLLQNDVNTIRAQLTKLSTAITSDTVLFSQSASKLVETLTYYASNGWFQDYIAAEQAVMAIDVVLSELTVKEKNKAILNSLYDLVQDEETFDSASFSQKLGSASFTY